MMTLRFPGSILLSLVLLLSGCYQTPQSDSSSVDRVLELIIEPPVASTISLVQARAYNPEKLRLEVSIDGQTANTVRRDDGNYQVAGEFGSSFSLKIDWFETVDSIEIQLATYLRTVDASTKSVVAVNSDSYVSNVFDMDGDSESNLDERINDTDPFNSNSCITCPTGVDVNIYSISPSEAPVIGFDNNNIFYDDVWAKAQFKDLDGDLSLRLFDPEARIDPAYESGSDFRWAAMHDGTYLYLLFLGELSPYQTPLDGDILFTGMNWGPDLVDAREHDFHLFDTNGNLSTKSDPDFGEDAANMAVCLCEGSQTVWELRIPLESPVRNAVVGEPFIFSVAYFDNSDGIADFDVVWDDDVDAILR